GQTLSRGILARLVCFLANELMRAEGPVFRDDSPAGTLSLTLLGYAHKAGTLLASTGFDTAIHVREIRGKCARCQPLRCIKESNMKIHGAASPFGNARSARTAKWSEGKVLPGFTSRTRWLWTRQCGLTRMPSRH